MQNGNFDLNESAAHAFMFSVAGVPTDPISPTATLTVRSPSGIVTAYVYPTDTNITRISAGSFERVLPMNEVGVWHLRSEGDLNRGSGVAHAVDEWTATVRESDVLS